MDIENYLSSFQRNDYQRDNFDSFLHKIKFDYRIPSIHIAGTNGKGSTAKYLNEIYIANNYKVGLFSTPDDFLNTITINNEPIQMEFVEQLINEYEKYFKKYDLSSFEIQTFIAFAYFKKMNVQLAVIECGMGGELDATNIFTPILSIITTVSIEHSMFLGDSLSEIAAHKAGIIKEYVPTLVGKLEGDALTVIVNKCKYENSELTIVDRYHNYVRDEKGASFDYRPYYGIRINNVTEYSAFAASLSIEATNILGSQLPVSEDKLKIGLKNMKIKSRFEIVNEKPLVIIDGAHNPEAIVQLRKEFDSIYEDQKFNIVFASFKDKSIANMLPEINLLGKVYLTTFDHPRARKQDDYFIYLNDYSYNENYKDLLNELLNKEDSLPIIVTGSLAFTYEVRKFFKDKNA